MHNPIKLPTKAGIVFKLYLFMKKITVQYDNYIVLCTIIQHTRCESSVRKKKRVRKKNR